MCAIAGILRLQADVELSSETVNAMLRRQQHRGPDGSGVIEHRACILGASRLAQLDEPGGRQPMQSPDGRWTLVFNGEIHNHRQLRQELVDRWCFRTRSDTEVLLAALVTWGDKALMRLNGMFAFFLWDEANQCGLAARDRLGVKPFVWTKTGGHLAFASEAKALLEVLPGRPTINERAVLEYFAAPCFSGVESPMFANMVYLPPGHLLRICTGQTQQCAWWQYDLAQAVCEDAAGLTQRMHEVLPQAVQYSMDTDAPAAVFLSGGLDSTLVAACGKKHGLTCSYTIAFEGQADFDYARALMVKSDDLPFAVEAAADMGLENRRVPVSRATLAEDLRTLAIQNDALPAWEQELAQHHLARAVAVEYRAVLVGDAADETHYGYGFMFDDACLQHPANILSRFGPVHLNQDRLAEAAALTDDYESMIRTAGHGSASRAEKLRGITHLIVQRWLPRLLHNGDIHTMAHGLEARVPFGDTALLDLAMQVHPELALRDGVEKSLLRQAAQGLMPEAARMRRKSSLSKDDACARIYQYEARKALDQSARLIGHWLDVEALRTLCHPDHSLSEMERSLLFRVICFHHWATAYHVREP